MEAAFFDLDKTVIDRASIAAFGRPFLKGGLINRRLVARAAISQLLYLYFGADEDRLVRVRESMLAVTKGWDRAQVRQIVRETMLQTMEPIMYAEALELMELHRAAGHRVYLVSASPEEIVLPLADLLGVDGAICSRGEVDEQGRYTGRMAFYAYGESKADAMRELAARHRARPRGEQRVLGLGHRPPHARGRRPARRNQPGSRAGQGRSRTRLGGTQLHQADSAARPGGPQHTSADDEPRRGRRRTDPVAARTTRSSCGLGRPPRRLIQTAGDFEDGGLVPTRRAADGRRARRSQPAGRG